jgi:hypothetical protein
MVCLPPSSATARLFTAPIVAAVFCLSSALWGDAQPLPSNLFLEPGPLIRPAEQTRSPSAYRRSRLARLNPMVAGGISATPFASPFRASLNLFSNEQHVAVFSQRETLGPGRSVCRGSVEGKQDSLVILALCQGAVAGSVFVPGRGGFQIQPASDGWEQIAEIDPDSSPPCGVSESSELSVSSSLTALKAFDEDPTGTQRVDTPPPTNSVVDLLVAYTPAAREGAGGTEGILALIDAAVAEANTAFENSLAQTRLQLVHQVEIDYTETGDIAKDLDALEEDEEESTTGNGSLREVHQLRRQYGADLVCLITETTGGPLGLANVMRELDVEFSEKAFSVVQREFAIAYYVLAHEVGHNFGCQHDRASSSGSGCFDYSHAYLFAVDGVRYHTIMAYQPGLPTPYFSNPDVLFLGVPTGVPESATNSANNAKTILLTAPTVALFSSVLQTGTPPQILLTAPPNGALLPAADIILEASVTDDDGSMVEVEFEINGVKVGEADIPPFVFIWTNAPPGTYSLRAVAKDSAGWESSTPIIVFTVAAPPPAFDMAASYRLADGTFHLGARGSPGQAFRMDASADLITWLPVATNSFTTEFFDLTDLGATNLDVRFYRLRSLP